MQNQGVALLGKIQPALLLVMLELEIKRKREEFVSFLFTYFGLFLFFRNSVKSFY